MQYRYAKLPLLHMYISLQKNIHPFFYDVDTAMIISKCTDK